MEGSPDATSKIEYLHSGFLPCTLKCQCIWDFSVGVYQWWVDSNSLKYFMKKKLFPVILVEFIDQFGSVFSGCVSNSKKKDPSSGERSQVSALKIANLRARKVEADSSRPG